MVAGICETESTMKGRVLRVIQTPVEFSACIFALLRNLEQDSQFSFQPERKVMAKNAQTTTQLHTSHTLVK